MALIENTKNFMNIPNKNIEDRTINVLENMIDKHLAMDYNFNRLDKEMSWDGFITIYKNNSKGISKENYEDEARVQIKGHVENPNENKGKNEALGKRKINCSLDYKDLKVYARNGGVLYFEIFALPDGTGSEIFYCSLYPSILKKYIDEKEQKLQRKSNKPKHPTVSIPFNRVYNENELYELVRQFCIEKYKQGSIGNLLVQNMIMLKDINKVKTITADIAETKDELVLLKRLASRDICLYGKTDKDEYERPIESPSNAKYFIRKDLNRSISVGNKVFYNEYKVILSSDNECTLIPSDNIKIYPYEGKIEFEPNSNIAGIAYDARFILSINDNRAYQINERSFDFSNAVLSKEFENNLKFYVELQDILCSIELKIDAPVKNLEKDVLAQLTHLMNIKKGIYRKQVKERVNIYNWKYKDSYCPLLLILDDEKNVTNIYNATYTKEYQTFAAANNNTKIPMFGCIEKAAVCNLYHYDYNQFKEQIESADINNETIEYLNNTALLLISIYDLHGDKEAIELAKMLYEKLLDVAEDEAYLVINMMQIKKRTGVLSEEDIKKICAFKDKEPLIQFGISVLSDNRMQAEKIYSGLSDEEKEQINTYPIYCLYERMK